MEQDQGLPVVLPRCMPIPCSQCSCTWEATLAQGHSVHLLISVQQPLLQEPSPGLRLVQHGHSLGPIFLPRTGPSRYFKIKAPNTPYFATSSPMCFFFPVSF